MELFKNLFSDWVGLLSLGTIVTAIVIGVVFAMMFISKSSAEE